MYYLKKLYVSTWHVYSYYEDDVELCPVYWSLDDVYVEIKEFLEDLREIETTYGFDFQGYFSEYEIIEV